VIDLNETHSANVSSSISRNFDPGSNSTIGSESQQTKQQLPMNSTEAGMQIERSEEQPSNTPSSIERILLSGLNLTLRRDSRCANEEARRISTSDGITKSDSRPKY
jgi:hypothetical protein